MIRYGLSAPGSFLQNNRLLMNRIHGFLLMAPTSDMLPGKLLSPEIIYLFPMDMNSNLWYPGFQVHQFYSIWSGVLQSQLPDGLPPRPVYVGRSWVNHFAEWFVTLLPRMCYRL